MIADLYEMPPKKAEDEIGTLLEQLELADAADDQIKAYSYGMQKKILLISLLVHHPQILFLDEPTSGIRSEKCAHRQRNFCENAVNRGCTVFMTTHILEIAERICDRVGIISKGQLIAIGTLAELQQKQRELHTQPTGINRHQTETLEDIFLNLTADA